MHTPRHLIIASLASAATFSLAFTLWMFITSRLYPGPISAIALFRVNLFTFGAALAVQLTYGGLVYLVLTRLAAFNLFTVLLAYVVPVLLFSWHASDTSQDLLGTIPWILFALSIGFVFWFFASA
jgi:hypothetical protein